ncbi:hypothetical protein [Paraburkholderia antibiotica]|uniref:Zinc ribbon domain-containing protein n=1 Tax=Paraburkholderia antibiotica TaxID=2728839 RepID=A0A7Y0A0A9_9BURK|nr:hypothetical protein [Paraburkholderia antibiotica]NML34119.1 hypothetical protein [Paraburkholderia antibiotica]
MSTQTATGHSFPTPCKRCGGTLYRQVDACPYCGATHPLDPDPHRRTGTPGSRASATHKPVPHFDDTPDMPGGSVLAAHTLPADELLPSEPLMHTALVSTETTIPDFEEPLYAPRNTVLTIRRVLYAIGAIVLIGIAYVGYALFSDSSESEDKGVEQITQDPRPTAGTAPTGTTTSGTIAPFAAVAPAQTPAAHSAAAVKPAAPSAAAPNAAPDMAAKPAPTAPPATVARATPVAPPTPNAALAATTVRPATQFHDAAQALQAARAAFRANDLSQALAAVAVAQTLQPGNSDARDLAGEMRPLVERRDNALQAAQNCVAQQSWPCARQHANEALAIDSSNDAAKSILERVIRETGWAPLPPPHAAAPGAALHDTSLAQAQQPTRALASG